MADAEDARAQALARELAGLERPCELLLHPVAVVHLVGLLQLALRHPKIAADSSHAQFGDTVIAAARVYFAACPAILAMIAEGDDPANDVAWTR